MLKKNPKLSKQQIKIYAVIECIAYFSNLVG